jgi:hypothetical protein
MIAVAGGILLAFFILFVLFGAAMTVRDTFRFAMRHKPYVYGLIGAAVLFAALTIAGSYDQSPAYHAFARRNAQ